MFTPRLDLGKEWFEASADPEERHRAICFTMDVVQQAARATEKNDCDLIAADPRVQETSSRTKLPHMGAYYKALDNFITLDAPPELLEQGMDITLAHFESSDRCPVLCSYLMHPYQVRLQVAKNRYAGSS